MTSKTVLVVSLIITVLTIVYLVAEYYGYLRFMKLYFFPLEKYFKSFSKIPKYKDKIVVAFMYKKDNISHFIKSLLDQSIRIDDIVMIQDGSSKLDPEIKKILSSRNYKNSVLASVIQAEPEAKTKVILVDSDMVYGKDFVQELVDASEENPEGIIYGRDKNNLKYGVLVKPKFFSCVDCYSDTDLLEKSRKKEIENVYNEIFEAY